MNWFPFSQRDRKAQTGETSDLPEESLNSKDYLLLYYALVGKVPKAEALKHVRRSRKLREKAKAVPYEHPCYPSGLEVYVSEAIRLIHPLSPVAGKYVQTCVGRYYPLLEEIEGERHKTLVPVFSDGEIWLVEEEYVSLTQPS
jgi:hypothetical protein